MSWMRETPDPNAEQPTRMCGSPRTCDSCPSYFCCVMKAATEKRIITARGRHTPKIGRMVQRSNRRGSRRARIQAMTKPRIEGSLRTRRAEFVYGAYRLHAAAIHAPIVNGPWETREDQTDSPGCAPMTRTFPPRTARDAAQGFVPRSITSQPWPRRWPGYTPLWHRYTDRIKSRCHTHATPRIAKHRFRQSV